MSKGKSDIQREFTSFDEKISNVRAEVENSRTPEANIKIASQNCGFDCFCSVARESDFATNTEHRQRPKANIRYALFVEKVFRSAFVCHFVYTSTWQNHFAHNATYITISRSIALRIAQQNEDCITPNRNHFPK